MGFDNIVPARCGDINDRIAFVLRRFGVAPPRFVADVAPKVRDVMQHQVASIPPDATSSDALAMMERGNIRVLPIVDDDRFCRGLISVFKMGKFLLSTSDRNFSSRRVLASLQALTRNLEAKLLFGVDVEEEEELLLMVAAMSVESFAARLSDYPRERVLVVVGDRRDIQQLAIEQRVRGLIVTGDLPVDEDLIELAQKNEVSLLVSPHDSATTTMLCRSAISVEHMKHEHFLSFREDESLSAIRDVAVASQFQAFPVLDAGKRVVGVLSKTDFLKKVDRKLILVDHNELSQAVRGADQVEIIEIIDHHRIGTFTSHQPMLFVNRPVGSTSTIVADLFFTYNLPLAKQVAGLLLAGLVSDTLNLTSPTTTREDATILARLSLISGIDPEEFTEQLFSTGSVLTGKPAGQAITTDCKEYEEAGKRFSVAQIEEIGFKRFWERKDDVYSALEDYRRDNTYSFSSLLVTDVVRQVSLLLVAGDGEFVSRIHYPEVASGVFELSGVVSRKKQLLPYLVHCLEQLGSTEPSALAGRTVEEFLSLEKEPLRIESEGGLLQVFSIEDNGIHEALQRRGEILAALEVCRGDQVASVVALAVSEAGAGEAVLFVAGIPDGGEKLGLPRLEDGVFSLNNQSTSKDALLRRIKQALCLTTD